MAIRDVILGYAKGAKGDPGDIGPKGDPGDIGPKGDPGSIADAEVTDTYGVAVTAGQKATAQALFDAITNKIANVLVSNDTLTQKLADYMLKSLMSNVQLNSTENVPTSALIYTMQQALDGLNSSLTPKAISLSGTYANNIYADRMGCIVVVNININVSATDTPKDTVLTTGLPKSNRGTYTKDIYGTTMALSPSGELTIGTRADSNYITTSFAYIAND